MSYLKDIAVFTRVVELKGFAAAGRALGLTAPSVSKQIARLEAELGVALLHRTTHNLFLTDAGQAFYDRCVRGLTEIEQARAEALAHNDLLQGRLRVHATLSVGQALVAPALTEFMIRYPDIHVELETGSTAINPMEHQTDIAIRTKTSRQTSPGHISLGQRILADVRQVVVAAPAYLERSGMPDSIEQIAERSCLLYITQTTSSENWQFRRGRQDLTIKITDPQLRSNNWLAVRHAAVSGLGLARLPDFTVREEIADGRLIPLFEGLVRSDQQVQALFPRSRRMPAKMRHLLDFLAARLAASGGKSKVASTTPACQQTARVKG